MIIWEERKRMMEPIPEEPARKKPNLGINFKSKIYLHKPFLKEKDVQKVEPSSSGTDLDSFKRESRKMMAKLEEKLKKFEEKGKKRNAQSSDSGSVRFFSKKNF